jgi:carboxylate-amine ligase
MPGSLEDVLGIAALSQCLVHALSAKIDEGAYQHDCHPMMVQQNKWRACRFGNKAQVVNSYTLEVQPVRDIVASLVELLRPVAEDLDCVEYLEHTIQMAEQPSWADRQVAIFRETDDPTEIVRRLSCEARIAPQPT